MLMGFVKKISILGTLIFHCVIVDFYVYVPFNGVSWMGNGSFGRKLVEMKTTVSGS